MCKEILLSSQVTLVTKMSVHICLHLTKLSLLLSLSLSCSYLQHRQWLCVNEVKVINIKPERLLPKMPPSCGSWEICKYLITSEMNRKTRFAQCLLGVRSLAAGQGGTAHTALAHSSQLLPSPAWCSPGWWSCLQPHKHSSVKSMAAFPWGSVGFELRLLRAPWMTAVPVWCGAVSAWFTAARGCGRKRSVSWNYATMQLLYIK